MKRRGFLKAAAAAAAFLGLLGAATAKAAPRPNTKGWRDNLWEKDAWVNRQPFIQADGSTVVMTRASVTVRPGCDVKDAADLFADTYLHPRLGFRRSFGVVRLTEGRKVAFTACDVETPR